MFSFFREAVLLLFLEVCLFVVVVVFLCVFCLFIFKKINYDDLKNFLLGMEVELIVLY